jgi:hypothetical protein
MGKFLRIFSTLLFGICFSANLHAQKKEGDMNRDLSNMFYTDTIPAPKPEPPKPAAPKPAPAKKAPAAPLRRVGIKYRIWHLTTGPNCENIDVQEASPHAVFHSGDRIRLLFEANVDGYLYVMQKGSTGRDRLLFPDPQLGVENRVQRGVQYPVPAKRWFSFDKNPGEEKLTVIVSRTPLKSVTQQIAAAQGTSSEGSVSVVSVVEELNQSVRPRDLAIFQEKSAAPANSTAAQPIAASVSQATIVINTNPDQNNAAYVEIKLKHE